MTFEPFTPATLLAILPEILLVALAALVMALDLIWPESRKRLLGVFAAAGLGLILVLGLIFSRPTGDTSHALIFGGMLRDDWAAYVFRLLFIFSGMIVTMISLDSPGVGGKGEYYAILIAAVFGMNFMASAADLIMLYLAIETTSIALYLLAGYLRDDDKSAESGLKYFLFGAFTSTVMLYGFSLLYGFTGQTNLYLLKEALGPDKVPPLVTVMAALLILVGFGFKVAAVPFHFWTPDVYEGAPTPITAFISVASKAAGFAVLIRVMLAVFSEAESYWVPVVIVIAMATMTLGNSLALAQKNIKRLLAYSSIAQAGYALVGLAAISTAGIAATIFYLVMYTLTNLAAFGVIILVSRVTQTDEIADYAGLSRRSPALALAFLVAFLSLGGMPPLAGFFGKFFVFAAAIEQGVAQNNSWLIWLAVVGVLNAIIGLYYYLVVLKVVYLYRSERENEKIPVPRAYGAALWVCVIGIILLGTWASPWIVTATAAAGNLF
jgi:NADH-quinone oxidoreductase subunit N